MIFLFSLYTSADGQFSPPAVFLHICLGDSGVKLMVVGSTG